MYVLINLILRLIDLYELLLIVDCIMSWVPANTGAVGDIKDALHKLCDPCLNIIREVIPVASGNGLGIDFSPMIAIVAFDLIKRLLWVVF